VIATASAPARTSTTKTWANVTLSRLKAIRRSSEDHEKNGTVKAGRRIRSVSASEASRTTRSGPSRAPSA
jgi:hypothetical protein